MTDDVDDVSANEEVSVEEEKDKNLFEDFKADGNHILKIPSRAAPQINRKPPTRGQWKAIKSVEPQSRPRVVIPSDDLSRSEPNVNRGPVLGVRGPAGSVPMFDPKSVKLKPVAQRPQTPPVQPKQQTPVVPEPVKEEKKEKEKEENKENKEGKENQDDARQKPKKKGLCIIS
eukprot:TRINITY_DN18280_c0_g1_i1.p1 TRINITY_DN18280_c0_g1~~TRINITY_DN18280_c0_g1_i1.p1  ORF type:complete len:193 (-),score=42.57 TRINITY_DN18280_c0_g1_i1:116-634(-)